MTTRIKKIFLSLVVMIGFSAYAWRFREPQTQAAEINLLPALTSANGNTHTSTPPVVTTTPSIRSGGEDGEGEDDGRSVTVSRPAAATPSPVSSPTPSTATGQYRNGQYTGSVADAFYGNVQVRVTVAGGKVTDVHFLQYPNDRSTSRFINGQAMPLLRQEAIQAQSANVSGVSGATATSQAFQQSLASALSQA